MTITGWKLEREDRASLLDQFPDEVGAHLDGACPNCTRGAFRADRPYEAEPGRQA